MPGAVPVGERFCFRTTQCPGDNVPACYGGGWQVLGLKPKFPPGARNKATLAVEALLDGEAETITRKAIELAKAATGPRCGSVLIGLRHPAKTAPRPPRR